MRLPRLLRRLHGRSLAELRERAEQSVAALGERAGVRDAGEPSDVALRARLRPNVAAAGLEAAITSVRDRVRPRFFPGMEDPKATAAFVGQRWPERAAEILRAAGDVIAGRFPLLGYAPLVLPGAVDWSHDPVHDVHAPQTHWSRIPYLDPAAAGDHKLVWELSRHQFLVTLGQAYALSGDERYADRAAALLSSWMDANPPKRGVNWASSLEVSFRAIAWVWALRFLRHSPAFPRGLVLRWLKYFEVSARHLARYLSTYFSPNTHLTGEALGLLYVGTQLPEFRQAQRWRRRGWEILLGCIQRHVRADGTYYEQSTYYHRYTLDIYLHARVLGAAHHLEGVERVDGAIARLGEFLVWTARADGTIPLFGDEDGGRLLFLDGRAGDDARSSVATAAALLGRVDFNTRLHSASDEVAWLLGAEGVRAVERLSARHPAGAARAFADGGFFVTRDGWGDESAVLTVDCGPLGAANGGHAHADTLAFDLAVGRSPVFVDTGTGRYTVSAVERDAMRSSLQHNTLSLDGASSSESAGPFQWRTMTAGVLDAWHVATEGTYFEGHHDGYRLLQPPARHRRQIVAAREGWWVVRDVVESEGGHDAVVNFQCAPGLDVTARGGELRVEDDGRSLVRVVALGAEGGWQLEEGIASRRYGSLEAAPRARYGFRSSGRTGAIFVITRGAPAASTVTHERAAAGERVRLVGNEYDDLLLFEPRGQVDGVRTDARVAWVRRRASDGVVQSVFVVGGTTVELDGARVARQDGGAVSAVRESSGWRVASEGAMPGGPDGRQT